MAKNVRQIHEGNAFYKDYTLMMIPLLLMAVFYYGPRVLTLTLVAVITARVADRIAAVLRSRRYDKTENSSIVIALIIVIMMPVTVPYRVVIVAVLAGILVAKEAFGGYQSYPFNPSAVGFCIATVAWPEEMQRYPQPQVWYSLPEGSTFGQLLDLWQYDNIALMEGPAATLRNGGLPKIDFWSLLLGNYATAIGTGCSVVILACALYLVLKKRMSVIAPIAFLAVSTLIAFFFPRYTEISFATWPQDIMLRLQVVKFELLSGSMIFAAVFLVPEPGTLPKNRVPQLIYGVLLGFATMMFSYFGSYTLGLCFAFLLVNAVSSYFDRAIASFNAKRKEAALNER